MMPVTVYGFLYMSLVIVWDCMCTLIHISALCFPNRKADALVTMLRSPSLSQRDSDSLDVSSEPASAPHEVATSSDQSFNLRVRLRGQIHKYPITQVRRVHVCLCVCACVCVCVCASVYVHVCVPMCICMCVCMCVCTCVYVCVYVHVCMYVCMCMRVCMCMCMCMYVCMKLFIITKSS